MYTLLQETLTNYCNHCFLSKHDKKEFGRSYAHRFCMIKCTVSSKLKHTGKSSKLISFALADVSPRCFGKSVEKSEAIWRK
ncbi:zinc-finger domain-containing protein [Bacillus aquiflavi]|uniref:Zinc-finger domain-containing protein n=1 Tax=Bacillus aquiflavi TaxID=2672567 RepID=A0A6B3VW52_9BACI|nr:zinc-finger domain-containing protein [Bacillus aquiflavi]NEY80525.1 zinc-finger domain-containing protein [Bacillus aquiflavi]UAC50041.1 zinc-finger domain-containing protein [Bacillus aquiflavi]